MAGEGEELPPVVATLDGDDSGFLAMLERDIEAARVFAADLQAALEEGIGGVTFSGSQIGAEGVAAAGEVIGEELAAGISEGAAGMDLRPELQASVSGAAETGQAAGEQMAAGIAEAAASTGDQVASEIAAPLTAGMAEAGAEAGAAAGEAIDAGLAASTATVGQELARQISDQLRLGLDAAAQSTMGVLGQANASGLGSTLASSAAGAGFLAGLPALLRAAGLMAGAALGEGIVEGSSGAGDQVAGQIGGELRGGIASSAEAAAGRLSDALVEGTSGIGDAISAQVAQEMGPGIADAGERAGEALKEALIEGAAGAGDVLGAEIGSGIPGGVTSGADAGAAAVQQAMQAVAPELAAEGEAAGVRYVEGLQQGLSSIGVPLGGMSLDELLTGGQGASPFVSDPNDPFRTVRQDVLEAEQAAQQGAAAIGAAASQALSGSIAFEAELDAVFEAILRGGEGMSVQLASAMTDAFHGVEADTTGFTQSELAIYEQFYATLEAQGEQAALDLAARLRLVSQAATSGMDFMAQGLTTFGQPIPTEINGAAPPQVSVPGLAVASEAKAAAGATDEMAAAATGADAAVGGMASTMGGPLMWGLLGVVGILPMFSGLLSGSSQAAQQAAKDQAALAQAVQQDSDMVGANTVTTITNQLATSGAAQTLQGYGISLSTAASAMAGAKGAQDEVSGSLDAQIQNLQAVIAEQEAHAAAGNAEIDTEKNQLAQLQATKAAFTQLESSVVDAVTQQNDLAQATLNAEQAVGVFNVQVKAADLALQQQAESAHVSATAQGAYLLTVTPGTQAYTQALNDQGIALAANAHNAQLNATALNDSLAPQSQLSGEAVQAALAYQQATTETSAYTGAINALYGQYGQTSGAQAAFTTALDGLHGKITSGTDAVNLNTVAGAKNFSQFQSVASAAESYAEKLYTQTGNTDQATKALQDMAGKLDTAASKAGLTKDQVKQLNDELFGVPDIKDITIKLDPTPAQQQMTALTGFINSEINSINDITPHVSGTKIPARAAGGPVEANQPYWVGEMGVPELFVPGASGFITPMDMVAPSGTVGSGGFGGLATAQATSTVVNVYLDGKLVTSGVRSSSQQYKTRNSLTGLN